MANYRRTTMAVHFSFYRCILLKAMISGIGSGFQSVKVSNILN